MSWLRGLRAAVAAATLVAAVQSQRWARWVLNALRISSAMPSIAAASRMAQYALAVLWATDIPSIRTSESGNGLPRRYPEVFTSSQSIVGRVAGTREAGR
jgi:hypothetical protein